MLKKIVKRTLHKAGFDIIRIRDNQLELTMEAALSRSKKRGLEIKTVIDIGASDGRWSDVCMKYYPNADYLLIEAQEGHKKGLDEFKSKNKNVDYILSAAGNKVGDVYFNNEDLFGGLASEYATKNSILVPVTTVDSEVKKRKLEGPYLIKLDTHGYEVPILEGAENTLKKTNLTIIEAYNYKLTDSSLRYFELCQYMENKGFSSIEIVDLTLREKDKTFWQMDIFFIPSNNYEFSYTQYK